MVKKGWIAVIFCAVLCACATLTVGFFGVTANAETTSEPVRPLVSTGKAEDGKAEWRRGNDTLTYNVVEEIKDSAQADGGDVIIRNDMNAEKNGFTEGETQGALMGGFADAAYPIAGLNIKFYAGKEIGTGTAGAIRFGFSSGSGWYTAQIHSVAWAFTLTKSKTATLYTYENGVRAKAGEYKSATVNRDYDYFKDPATAGYDGNSTFAGKLNTIRIIPESGSLNLYLNGDKVFDMTELGVVSKVISQADSHGMFFSLHIEGTLNAGSAVKIVEMYNEELPEEWTDGCTDLYTSTTAGNMENVQKNDGTTKFRGKDGNANYDLTYKTAQEYADLTTSFYYDGKETAVGDTFTMKLTDSGEGTNSVSLEFAKKTENKADLTVKNGNAVLGTKEVDFYYNGTTPNIVALKEVVFYELTVNDEKVELDLSALSGNEFTANKVKVGYYIAATAASEFIPVSYTSKAIENVGQLTGMTISGNPTIKNDGTDDLIFSKTHSAFSVKADADSVIPDSFTLVYKIGKYDAKTKGLRIDVGNNAANLGFEILPANDAQNASLCLFVKTGENAEEKLAEEEIDYDWNYEFGERKIAFADTDGEFIVFADDIPAITVDGASDIAKIKSAVEAMNAPRVPATFTVQDEALTVFAYKGYKFFAGKSAEVGWSGGMDTEVDFGYGANNDVVIGFGANLNYKKSVTTPVDGFYIEFKSYQKKSGMMPTWCLSSTTAWYSTSTAIQFAVDMPKDGDTCQARLVLRYTNTKNDTFTYAVKNTSSNRSIATYAIDTWHWNDGVYNTLQLDCVDGAWVWKANGVAVTEQIKSKETDEDVQYSDYYKELFTTYTRTGNIADVQVYTFKDFAGSAYMIKSISEYIPNAKPVATAPVLDQSYTVGDTVTVTLGEVFSDADNDTLTYTLGVGSVGAIENGVWKFTAGEAGNYTVTVIANDGNGGETELTFTVNVQAKSIGGNGGGGCGSQMGTIGWGFGMLLLVAAACAICLKKKHS